MQHFLVYNGKNRQDANSSTTLRSVFTRVGKTEFLIWIIKLFAHISPHSAPNIRPWTKMFHFSENYPFNYPRSVHTDPCVISSVCLPVAGEFLQKDRKLLQWWELQTRVFKELGCCSEKVLTATSLQEGIQVACTQAQQKKKELLTKPFCWWAPHFWLMLKLPRRWKWLRSFGHTF